MERGRGAAVSAPGNRGTLSTVLLLGFTPLLTRPFAVRPIVNLLPTYGLVSQLLTVAHLSQ